MQVWEFPGWGTSKYIDDLHVENSEEKLNLGLSKDQIHKLDEWPATAICGNDILSSCLYVSAISIRQAGVVAPLALILVAGVLYLFRKIYAEVGSALPLNGGSYTVLLNTTSKTVAAAAACLTILSYLATAVISAGEAMHYAHNLLPVLPVMLATVCLLGFFAFLNLVGISESSRVALGIFIVHISSLVLLVGAGLLFLFLQPEVLIENLTNTNGMSGRGFLTAFFLGFCAAMLGVSGFESSANFIEEQKPGVFPKTLRNMWLGVTVFNPLICFLALAVLPMDKILANETSLLAVMGQEGGGHWLRLIIGVDAVLVLSGAVLTSYVGVIGLCRRMALDKCLPQIFLRENNWRRTNHWIILAFFLLCCAILGVTGGHVDKLAGVYILSFLSVMCLFAVGNMFLKLRRDKLPRSIRASWLATVTAFVAVFLALLGNMTGSNVQIFLSFYIVIGGSVLIMFKRVPILKIVLLSLENAAELTPLFKRTTEFAVKKWIRKIGDNNPIIYFTKGDDLQVLNQAALYVLNNEQTNNLIVVNVFKEGDAVPPGLSSHLSTIDLIYPELKVDFISVKGNFGPQMIEALSSKLNVPKNNMFIGTPGNRFPHQIENLGGVRLILG
jgi:amino acid transporter